MATQLTPTWMEKPNLNQQSVPTGLEYLSILDELSVIQRKECLEIFTGWETRNRFRILNKNGQQCYFAQEESSVMMRLCCGKFRGFVLHITDNTDTEVIRIRREFKCCSGCSCCANNDYCAFLLTVESPPGQVIGYVRQEAYCIKMHLTIRDNEFKPILSIQGPYCVWNAGACCDTQFDIMGNDGVTPIGSVRKVFGGLMKEMFTNADNFAVTFPQDLDVKLKAVLLAATFLIDFMYFEQDNSN